MSKEIPDPFLCRELGQILDDRPPDCPWHCHRCKHGNLKKQWKRYKKPFKPYTKEEFAGFNRLNRKLTDLEFAIQKEVIRLRALVNRRIRSKDRFLSDHEIEVEIGFILRKSDPDYDKLEGDPCYYLRSNSGFAFTNKVCLYCDGNDWSESYGIDSSFPLLDKKCCYMFHELCDDFHDRRVLLRFGEIWTDVKLVLQNFRRI
ncbi:MAG: hypothetical protein PHW04_03625 [Candidatus Wallbacteria bacterium]|nr:hypothetical protein [Candidatus Wallbacteria bacterium]